jgi:hypothetical protein
MAFDVSVEKIVERYPVAWSVLLSALYFYSGLSTEPLYPRNGTAWQSRSTSALLHLWSCARYLIGKATCPHYNIRLQCQC